MAVLGMVGTSLWLTEERAVMAPGDTAEIAGFTIKMEEIRVGKVANYETEMSVFTLLKNGKPVGTLTPERRWYPVAQDQTVEADVLPRWGHDIYVAIGEPRGENNQARVVRLYHHPLIYYIWTGALLMVGGGLVSLGDRKYRIGAPTRRSKAVPMPPAGGSQPDQAAVPAE